jgi:hypothetical protein
VPLKNQSFSAFWKQEEMDDSYAEVAKKLRLIRKKLRQVLDLFLKFIIYLKSENVVILVSQLNEDSFRDIKRYTSCCGA